MTGFSLIDWIQLLEKVKFAYIDEDGTGTNILSSDVNEDKMNIPLVFIISDKTGSTNHIAISKVEEDNTTTTIHDQLNLGGNETVVYTVQQLVALVPRIEGGANLEFNADTGNVDVTMVYVNNEEV